MTTETAEQRLARGIRMSDEVKRRKRDELMAYSAVALTRSMVGQSTRDLLRLAAEGHALEAVRALREAVLDSASDRSWSKQMEVSERRAHLAQALDQLDSLGGPVDSYRNGGRLFHDTLASRLGHADATDRLKRAREVAELRALGLGTSGDTFSPPCTTSVSSPTCPGPSVSSPA